MKSLVAFEAAARHLSFTRAGQEMMICRESVSRHIRILEKHLGVKLFERHYRSLELTEAGKTFQGGVADGLEIIARAAADVQRLDKPSKIAVTTTIAITTFWLTPRLPRFRLEHPDVEIRVNATDTPPDLVGEGIDVGILYGTGQWPGLEATKLFDIETFPVCSPEYLKTAGPIETPRDLHGQTLLYLYGEVHALENWAWWMEETGAPMRSSSHSLGFDSYVNVMQATLDGQGIALGFSHVVNDLLAEGRLVRPIEHACGNCPDIYLAVPRSKEPTPNARKFIDWVIREADGATELLR